MDLGKPWEFRELQPFGHGELTTLAFDQYVGGCQLVDCCGPVELTGAESTDLGNEARCRWCGQAYHQLPDGTVTLDSSTNSRPVEAAGRGLLRLGRVLRR